MRTRGLISIAVILLGSAAPLLGEQIVLNHGQTIEADVVREYPDTIVIDLGYDVLSIPRAHISAIEEQADDGQEDATDAVYTTDDLYSTNAGLKPQTVKQHAEQIGEAVIKVSVPGAIGSGFFISREGHLITNFHVIEDETKIAIVLFRKIGNEFKNQKFEDVDIVATNPFLDLALLKVNLPDDYTPTFVYLGADDSLRDGDHVFAIGTPLGLERSVSRGIVSRRNRAMEGLAYVQTTTQINPGNSGGPLFNMRGEVIGVTNMIIPAGEGLNFAIPIRYVVDFLKNRDAFAYNPESSEAGYRYLQPPARQDATPPNLTEE